jgi:hypothetical protein
VCVLICRVGERPILAANRDEAYARPFAAPRLWVAATPFWAPRDEEEGGTWLGVNARGVVAAITNRSALPERRGLPSRGGLVVAALEAPTLDRARARVETEVAAGPRNPFQLLVAQGARAFLAVHGPEGTRVRDLPPGFHVLSNLHAEGEIELPLAPDASLDDLRVLLADRAICKDAGWRGTVASALIEPGRAFLFADGPPDEAPFEPVPGYPGWGCVPYPTLHSAPAAERRGLRTGVSPAPPSPR